MSDRLKLPLNHPAVMKADDQFYKNHPEMAQNGQRVPLDATDPAQAKLRRKGVKFYQANNGQVEGPPPNKKEPAAPIQECPSCSEKQGLLVVNVVDQDD